MMRHTLLALAFAAALPMTAQSPFHVASKSLLGGDGGWDYVVPDLPSHRLFIAREDRVMVVDENSGKLLGEVMGIHGAHGTAIAEGTGHGFATSSEDKSIVMFDSKSLKVLSRIPAADDADGIIYDKPSGHVFSMNGDANSSTVVDAKTGKLISNIPLGGKPEYAVSTGDGKIYANLVDKAEIVEIDTHTNAVTKHWSTLPCKLPVAMTADTAHHRLFSGCRSGVMAVVNYDSGKVIATLPIGKGVDSAGFDAATGNLFAANADGTLTVMHQDDADHYHVVETLTTPLGSRSMGIDPNMHRVFLVAAEFAPAVAGSRKRTVLPGTFTLLTIEQ